MICARCGSRFKCSLRCSLVVLGLISEYPYPTRCLCLNCRITRDLPSFIAEEFKNKWLEELFRKCRTCYNISYKKFITYLL